MSRATSKERRYTSARKRAEGQSTGFRAGYFRLPDGVTLFKPKVGTQLIDILPYEAGENNPWAEPGQLHWERSFYVHRNIGADQSAVICPRMNSKKPCPICEARAKLMKKGGEANEELIKDLSPKQRQLFNLINLKDPDKGVQLWDISYHLFGKALDARLRNADEDDGWDSFFFLEGGLTLKVGMAEKSNAGYSFTEAESIDFKPRKEDYEDSILEEVHCLDELIVELPYDKLKALYLQEEAGADEEEEEEEEKPHRKSRAKQPEPEEEEEEEEAEEVEEEEEEETETKKPSKHSSKPAGKSSPTSKKPKGEEDEDEDWDDFDEEEKPAKSKKSKAEPEEEEEEEVEEPEAEEEEVEEPEEEEEEEAPRKRKSRAKPKAAEPEEDEDWEEDAEEEEKPRVHAADEEEEEEEKPRKRTRH